MNNEDQGIALNIQTNTDTVFSANNIFAGTLKILVGIPKVYSNESNIINSDLSYFHFNSIATYDYHLTSQSPGIDSALKLNQDYLSYSLIPNKEYLHPSTWKTRFADQHPDIGAFELQQITRNQNVQQKDLAGYYDVFSKSFLLLNKPKIENGKNLYFAVFNSEGKMLMYKEIPMPGIIGLSTLQAGVYYYTISNQQKLLSGSFEVTH